MSSAARLVKVSSKIRLGWMPWSRSQAARATSVPVLPVPAPARISSGPPWWVAARLLISIEPVKDVGLAAHGH